MLTSHQDDACKDMLGNDGYVLLYRAKGQKAPGAASGPPLSASTQSSQSPVGTERCARQIDCSLSTVGDIENMTSGNGHGGGDKGKKEGYSTIKPVNIA